MAVGSIRGGRSRGSRIKRSSKRAMSSAFQFRRWTCQQPRAKAVMGINAVVRLGIGIGDREEGAHTQDDYAGAVFSVGGY